MRLSNTEIGDAIDGRWVVDELLPLLQAGSPPPEIVAELVTDGNAAGATTTVTVIGLGLVAPAAMTVALVHVAVLLPTIS